MSSLKPDHPTLRYLLTYAKVIAVVGHSEKPHRDSYQVAQFLRNVGYEIYPINPRVDEIDGYLSYASLRDVPAPIDIVNVFRRAEFLQQILDDAIAVQAPTLWTQLGIADDAIAEQAKAAGLNVIMDTCIKVEHQRLQIENLETST
ncbi:MAG: CoA-binding protein [Thermosynechococcaceae cyanobacterium]